MRIVFPQRGDRIDERQVILLAREAADDQDHLTAGRNPEPRAQLRIPRRAPAGTDRVVNHFDAVPWSAARGQFVAERLADGQDVVRRAERPAVELVVDARA